MPMGDAEALSITGYLSAGLALSGTASVCRGSASHTRVPSPEFIRVILSLPTALPVTLMLILSAGFSGSNAAVGPLLVVADIAFENSEIFCQRSKLLTEK